MASIIQKLMAPFKPMAPGALPKVAKDCRDAADKYRSCAELLVTASDFFDDGSFEAGYNYLKMAKTALGEK